MSNIPVMIVSGAYGRDYKNKAAAVDAWNRGVDFMCRSMRENGRSCSNRDFAKSQTVELRYANERQLVMVKGNGSELMPAYDCDGVCS